MTIATATATTREEGATKTCPNCNATVANVQGLTDCPGCNWTDV